MRFDWIVGALLLVTGYQVESASPKVSQLLAELSLREKIGQMTQVEISLVLKDGSKYEVDENKMNHVIRDYGVGSILNSPFSGQDVHGGLNAQQWLNIINPIQDFAMNSTASKIPIIYGLDSLHGANYISGSTLFPHPIGVASSFDPELAKISSEITAKDTRAAGVHWIFGPNVENAINPLWSRVYETYGEDPLVCSRFGAAATIGLQGDDISNSEKAAACLKHYVGYGAPRSGKDRTDAWIPESYLRQYFLPSFKASIDAGAETIMVNSGSINGIPVHASYEILTTILREELGFKGVIVSDWEDIIKLFSYHRLTSTEREATKLAVLAGVDMSMVPNSLSFADHLYDLVNSGEITEARIDESVTRILELKEKLGLLDGIVQNDPELLKTVGSEEDRLVSYQTACESITLGKNDGVLPLDWIQPGQTIMVTGPGGNSVANLCGGWTIHWQGMMSDDEIEFRSTVFDGLRDAAPSANVVYKPGCDFKECNAQQLEEARLQALNSSVVVLVIGEAPQAESPGNINDLTLSGSQLELYHTLKSTGTRIVLVVVGGRARVLGAADQSNAILVAYLPCAEGGKAIGDILMGKVNPSSKFPFSYPRSTGDFDVYYHKPWGYYSQGVNDPFHDPLFPFGTGLSYTTFTYSNMYVTPGEVPIGQSVKVGVTVTNSGSRAGKEPVLLFLQQKYRKAITPEEMLLKDFTKIFLEPGQQINVEFTLDAEDMSFFVKGPTPLIETGLFTAFIHDQKVEFHVV